MLLEIAFLTSLVVHEWGTFTSVAGEDGAAMGWQTLSGPSDLPCFVHRLDQRNLKIADVGTVRMETPVLYFYPLKPLTVSVHVNFPAGRVTEWYPQANSVQPSASRRGWIDWNNVHVVPAGAPLPKLGESSHYYAARNTDSWPLQNEHENEKLLFYRGIGDFAVDLRATVHSDGVSLHNAGFATIPAAIVFENHAGHTGYHVVRSVKVSSEDLAEIKFSALTGTFDNLCADLENELTEMGLYRKEAHAMIETWRDSWFEEGLRIFYILPRSTVDSLLPITISPSPGQLARVFVGRVELLSPRMREDISAALLNGEVPVLRKYGRFLDAFLQEMGNPPMSEHSSEFMERSYRQARIESEKLTCTK